jgi:hypothetical protein
MMNSRFPLLTRHKYKLAVFLLLNAAAAMCIVMIWARFLYSGSQRYASLIWNLFLAWIPFALSYVTFMVTGRRITLYLLVPGFALLWLIFFPNAPYILTDLQHLTDVVSNVPVWYDVILLVWFSWTGMLMGVVSLNLMQDRQAESAGRLGIRAASARLPAESMSSSASKLGRLAGSRCGGGGRLELAG